jgi:hypothetical protein
VEGTFARPDRSNSIRRIRFLPQVAALIGAIAYELRYTLVANGGAPGPSTTLTLTSSRKLTITGLTPAGTYQFQVRALGKLASMTGAPR